jgi:hypothetical protein
VPGESTWQRADDDCHRNTPTKLRRKEANNKLGGPLSFSFPWQQASKSELKSSYFLLHKTSGKNLILNGTHL